MSSQSSPTLILDVSARRSEGRVAIVAIALAGLTPFLLIPDVALAMLAGTALGASAGALFVRARWLGQGLARVIWAADGTWGLWDAGGAKATGTLRPDSRVTARLVWLHWNLESGGERTLLLIGQDLPTSERRRLVVRLRLEGSRPMPSVQLVDA
jgi:hypothetical protein